MAKKILYVQTAFLGDLCLAVPSLQKIKQQWPQAELIVIVRKGLGQLLTGFNLCDQVYEVEKGNSHSYSELKKKLLAESFEIIFCAHESLRSAWLVFNLKSRLKVGFKKTWNFWAFDERVQKNKHWPESFRQLQLLAASAPELQNLISQFDWKSYLEVQNKRSDIIYLPDLPNWISPNLLKYEGELSTKIAIFAGSVWGTKQWKPEKFASLIQALLLKGLSVDLFGSPAESALNSKIIELVSAQLGSNSALQRLKNRAGELGLCALVRELAQYKKVISNDSGGQHLAALAGTPTVTLFGPTVLDFGYRSISKSSIVVQNSSLPCRPCGAHGPMKCPLGHHLCMQDNEVPLDLI